MPYEVSMSGGSPWGFRLAGGPFAGKPTTISRVTPGGKAGQANVMQGDALIAINGFNTTHLDLPELMEMIKISGWTLHLTLISQDEARETSSQKRSSEANITAMTDIERPRSRLVMTPLNEKMSRSSSRTSGKAEKADSSNPDLAGQSRETPQNQQRAPSAGRNGPNSRPSSQIRSDKSSFHSMNEQDSDHMTLTDSLSEGFKSDKMSVTNGMENSNSQIQQMPKIVIKVGGKPNRSHEDLRPQMRHNCDSNNTIQPLEAESSSQQNLKPPTPSPRPRSRKTVDETEKELNKEDEDEKSKEKHENSSKKLPDYIRRQLKPPKVRPVYNPQVSWLHQKLRIGPKEVNGLTDPGNSLKMAAAAYPCQPIEIEGPLSAKIVHSQYNTPVGMYSANQIVNTLVSTAAAEGADVPDPAVFGDQQVSVDKNTAVYKMVHDENRSSSAPAQSRSIQILDALLEHGRDMPQRIM